MHTGSIRRDTIVIVIGKPRLFEANHYIPERRPPENATREESPPNLPKDNRASGRLLRAC